MSRVSTGAGDPEPELPGDGVTATAEVVAATPETETAEVVDEPETVVDEPEPERGEPEPEVAVDSEPHPQGPWTTGGNLNISLAARASPPA